MKNIIIQSLIVSIISILTCINPIFSQVDNSDSKKIQELEKRINDLEKEIDIIRTSKQDKTVSQISDINSYKIILTSKMNFAIGMDIPMGNENLLSGKFLMKYSFVNEVVDKLPKLNFLNHFVVRDFSHTGLIDHYIDIGKFSNYDEENKIAYYAKGLKPITLENIDNTCYHFEIEIGYFDTLEMAEKFLNDTHLNYKKYQIIEVKSN